jgi:hypothetical protein
MIAKIRIRVEWMIQNVTGIPIRHAPLITLVLRREIHPRNNYLTHFFFKTLSLFQNYPTMLLFVFLFIQRE